MEQRGMLYPVMVVAGIAVIILSLVGTAAITGLLPSAESRQEAFAAEAQGNAAAQPQARRSTTTPSHTRGVSDSRAVKVAQAPACASCGTIESVNLTEVKGSGSGVGAVTGGVAGAVLGNQIGKGSGRTVATLAGAAGGAFLGNEIEKNVKKTTRYAIRVRMDDGSVKTVYQATEPGYGAGDRVKVTNGSIAALG